MLEEADLAEALDRAVGVPYDSQIEVEFTGGDGGGSAVVAALDGREARARMPWADVARLLAPLLDVSSIRAAG